MTAIDLTGKRFGKVTVLERAPNKPRHSSAQWRCKCDCGTLWIVASQHLRGGMTVRCRKCIRVPLQGLRFGRLIVTGPAPREVRAATKARWMCTCDCGNVVNTRTDYLRSGRTTSCGCWLNSARKGPSYASWTQVYCKLRGAASYSHARKIEWTLTREETIAITSQRCHYCNAEPSQSRSLKTRPQDAVKFNGIDRVDSSRGYTPDNVVPCCTACNCAKKTMSLAEFKAWICKVYAHFVLAGDHAATSAASEESESWCRGQNNGGS